MGDLPDWLRIPDGFASSGDPVDENPFALNDPRHTVWRDATIVAEREWARVNALSLTAPIPSSAGRVYVNLLVMRFAVWAKRGVRVVWSDDDLQHYERWLLSYANAILAEQAEKFTGNPPPFPPDRALQEARRRLGEQIHHWTAQARRYRAKHLAHRASDGAFPKRSALRSSNAGNA